MNQYEVAILYDPGLEVDLDKATNKVSKIFKEAGAVVKNTDNWGKRKLAYPINGQDHGIYVFYTVELQPESINKVESKFNITDEIIRFLIVRIDLKAEAKAKAAKAEQASEARESAKYKESKEKNDEE